MTTDYSTKTIDELKYIVRDAGQAATAMRDHDPAAEAKYLDQMNEAASELYRRRTSFDWVTVLAVAREHGVRMGRQCAERWTADLMQKLPAERRWCELEAWMLDLADEQRAELEVPR